MLQPESTQTPPPSSVELSIVVPCFNEGLCIPLFYQETLSSLQDSQLEKLQNLEFIFVDDGSTDDTLRQLRVLAHKDQRVRYLSFSRNFGKEAALMAGIEHSRGNFVAIMDADMQDPPSLLPKLLNAVRSEQCDLARARRISRDGEPRIRSFFARLFYRMMNRFAQIDIADGARDYMVMNRKVVDSILELKEYNRFFKAIAGWVGYKTEWFEYHNVERIAGESKWGFFSLTKYALDGIISFSTTPLTVVSICGIVCAAIAAILMIVIVLRALFFGDPVAGWPSTISILLFVGGLQLMCLGILGQYLAKTYLETKKRPLYFVAEDSNDERGRATDS